MTDPKQVEKLLTDWKKEVKSDYVPEDEEDDNPQFMKAVTEWSGDLDFSYDAEEACTKILLHRMR